MPRPAGGRAIAAARAVLSLALIILFAATPAASRAQSAPVVVRADRMLDVEAGRIVSDAVVTVRDGRIVGVGEAAAAAGADVIELGDMTLLPGLIDAHGSILDDEAIELMRERRTYLVPTTYLVDAIDLDALPAPIPAKAEYVLPIMRESLRRAIAAGVPIAFDTDAAVYPHGDNAREFAVYVRLGMSPADAIRTATTEAAALLGVDDRGVIAEGRLADLIAVPGTRYATSARSRTCAS